jgi:hypothetical protein
VGAVTRARRQLLQRHGHVLVVTKRDFVFMLRDETVGYRQSGADLDQSGQADLFTLGLAITVSE